MMPLVRLMPIGRRALVGLAVAAIVASCGPVSPERAARECEERAREAQGPTGSVAIGIGSDGPVSRVEIGVSSDFLRGRDPIEVYESCVRQKTGQPPVRPPRLR